MLPLVYACDSVLMVDDGRAIVSSRDSFAHHHLMEVMTEFPACSPFDTYFILKISHTSVYKGSLMAYTSFGGKVKLDGPLIKYVQAGTVIVCHKALLTSEAFEPVIICTEDKRTVHITTKEQATYVYGLVAKMLQQEARYDSN